MESSRYLLAWVAMNVQEFSPGVFAIVHNLPPDYPWCGRATSRQAAEDHARALNEAWWKEFRAARTTHPPRARERWAFARLRDFALNYASEVRKLIRR